MRRMRGGEIGPVPRGLIIVPEWPYCFDSEWFFFQEAPPANIRAIITGLRKGRSRRWR